MPRGTNGLVLAVLGALSALPGVAAAMPVATFPAVLAATPPMGWNSWDRFGCAINVAEAPHGVVMLVVAP